MQIKSKQIVKENREREEENVIVLKTENLYWMLKSLTDDI